MDKLKIHYFKMRQQNLAREISEELGDVDYNITFIQHYSTNGQEEGKIDVDQIIIPESICPSRKSRIIVSMYFASEYDQKLIERMLHRWFKVIKGKEWFNITYSVNLNSI